MLSRMTIWDKILIFLLIVMNLAFLGMAVVFNTKEGTKTIEIKVNGKLVERLSLTEDAKDIYSFNFGEKTGYVEVKDGAVRMLEMDEVICPEGICSKTGWIKEEYETIVCMPNGIIVNIENNDNSQEKDNDIDIVA